jgi:hypothetical protein
MLYFHNPISFDEFLCQLYGKLILLLLSSSVMFEMRALAIKTKKLEASEMKVSDNIQKHYHFEALFVGDKRIIYTILLKYIKIYQNILKYHKNCYKIVIFKIAHLLKDRAAKPWV